MTRESSPYRLCAVLACGVSSGVLVLAYVAIVLTTGNPWPWFEIVHESGDRTLLATIFFFEHAARELPLDMILGAAVGGSAIFVFPPGADVSPGTARQWKLALCLLSVVAVILGGTLWEGGFTMLVENVLQFPTRPGAPVEWGGHWRYHFLSHIMLMSVSLGAAGLLVLHARGTSGSGFGAGLRVFGVTVGVFAGLTAVFVPNLDPFRDPVFLGHQLREAFTHSLVTVPLAWGVCILLARAQWHAPDEGTVSVRGPLMAGTCGVLVGLFLLISGLVKSVASQGQTEGLAALIFPHFFEHSFSYGVAGLMAGLVYESVQGAKG